MRKRKTIRRGFALFVSLVMLFGMTFSGVPTFAGEEIAKASEAVEAVEPISQDHQKEIDQQLDVAENDSVNSCEQNLEEQNLEEQNLEEQNLEVQNLEEQNLEVQNLEEQNLEVQNLEEQNLEVQKPVDRSPESADSSPLFLPIYIPTHSSRSRAGVKGSQENPVVIGEVIGEDHPTIPGQVMLFKQAKPVTGMVNTWDITLRIEGKDKPITSDIILVMDTSRSMSGTRLISAKKAANKFIDTLLTSNNTTTQIGLVTFAEAAQIKSQLTKNAGDLKSIVNQLSADGGTFTQAGVKRAEAMLATSTANNKHIVLFSDGRPTYSYQIPTKSVRQAGYVLDDEGDYVTGINYSTSAYGETRVGSGSSMFRFIENYEGKRAYYHHGNSAIAEAGFAKSSGYRVWTIALEVDQTGRDVLQQMASPESYYTSDPAGLADVFDIIAGEIGAAVKDAKVTDPMGGGFQVPIGEVTKMTATQGEPSYDTGTKTITWNPGTLTTELPGDSTIKYAELKYRVELNDDILTQTPDANGEYATNGNANISYKDASGNSQTQAFPVPRVNPVLYKVVKELQDKDGNVITADRNFTIDITGSWGKNAENGTKSFILNTNTQSSTKLLTDLRWASTYTFDETGTNVGSLADYEIKYYVNNVEQTGASRSFEIVDGNTDDVEVKVVNKEKPGTLTITKVLDQSVVQSPAKRNGTKAAVSFSFTVTGPDDFTPVSFSLPEADSWTKELTGLAKGTYTVTETTQEDWTTTVQVNIDPPVPGNSASVNIAIGALNQSVTVTNKQKDNMSVTATKNWDGGPADKPAIWFQLLRVDSETSTTKIGSPRLVPDPVENVATETWKQTDSDVNENDFVRYDANGKAYEYKVQEVNAQGEDYTPANYSKVESGLTVTNTYTPDKITIDVTKEWVDQENEAGIRPESVTIRLFADEEDTGKTIVLSEDVEWTGVFTDLDKQHLDGVEIVYSVEEEEIDSRYYPVVSGDADEGFVITNYTVQSEVVVVVPVDITWDDADDQDGMRPDSVTIELIANGKVIDSKVITEADGWEREFKDLPKFKDGKEIVYTIAEKQVDGYTTVIDGYHVINKHVPIKISVNLTKHWEDKDDEAGIRPESITVHLFADGVDTGKKLVLTEQVEWKGVFADLDKFKKGVEIKYSVKEDEVDGYTAEIVSNDGVDFSITNCPVLGEEIVVPTTGESRGIHWMMGIGLMVAGAGGLLLIEIRRRKAARKS